MCVSLKSFKTEREIELINTAPGSSLMLEVAGAVVLSWVLCKLGDYGFKFRHAFFTGIAFCLISSLLYVTKSLLSISSGIVIAILGFAIVSGFLLSDKWTLKTKKVKRCEVVAVSALIVSVLFALGWGAVLSYSVIYPALAKFRYTGVLYTAFGALGIFFQALLESFLLSVVFSFALSMFCSLETR